MRKFVVVSKDMSGLGFCLLNKSDTVIIARNPDEETRKDPDKLKQFNNVGKGMVDVWDLKDVMAVRKEMRDWYFVLCFLALLRLRGKKIK